MSVAFLAGVVAGYGVAVPVGAIAVLIVGLTARTSFRVGASAALGVATADGLYAAVAAFGGSAAVAAFGGSAAVVAFGGSAAVVAFGGSAAVVALAVALLLA